MIRDTFYFFYIFSLSLICKDESMKESIKKYWKFILIPVLIFIDCSIWWVIKNEMPVDYVTIAFLNTGSKTEAIYIESPTHTKILINSGPPHILLPELEKILPFYIRSLDTLIFTNTNTNNYVGMLDVVPLYHVSRIVEPDILQLATETSTPLFVQFQNLIQAKKISTVVMQQGMVLHLGGGADVSIVSLAGTSTSTTKNKNNSLVVKLTYGPATVVFTGKDDLPNMLNSFHISTSTIIKNTTVIARLSSFGMRVSYK